jgi:hypothetical protein
MPKRRLQDLEGSFTLVTSLMVAGKIEIVTPQMIQVLGNALGCDWGTYWKVDSELYQLRPVATWSNLDVESRDLDNDTKSRTLSLSEGTAGHVWRNRKPVWTLDLVKDMCLPRSLDAERAGLHGGIWFAIKTETTVYGVVELLGKDLVSPNDELLTRIERFGVHLGKIFEDKFSTGLSTP